MEVKKLLIKGNPLLSLANTIDWNYVYNVPTVNITSNDHTHDDRYYRISDVRARIDSATSAINDLTEKVDLLNETTGISLDSSDASFYLPSESTSFTNGFTISLGIIMKSTTLGIIFNKEESYELQITPDGYLSYALQQDGETLNWNWIYTGIKLQVNARHKITFCYDGVNTRVTIYIDGGLFYDSDITTEFGTASTIGAYKTTDNGLTKTTTEVPIPTSLAQVTDDLKFGLRSSNGYPLTGSLFDTIVLYDRFLSSDEVKSVLSLAENKISTIPNLVAYYNFEGTSPLLDKSTHGVVAKTTGSISYKIL